MNISMPPAGTSPAKCARRRATLKAVVFTVVFLFTLGATAQGGTPRPTKGSASILFALVVGVGGPAVLLLTRRDGRER